MRKFPQRLALSHSLHVARITVDWIKFHKCAPSKMDKDGKTEPAHVKDLIQKWRCLSNDLRSKNKELDDARGSLREFEVTHNKAKQDWEVEKEKLRNTINTVLADVTNKKMELKSIERETAELQVKVHERRRRNEEHQRVLDKRRKAVVEQLQSAEVRDAAVHDRYRTFEATRAEAKQQLVSAIKNVEAAIPQELEAHNQKVTQLRSKIEEITANMEAEAKSWELEQAMREWNRKSDARKWLLEEVSAAESGKDVWAELLQDANSLHIGDSLAAVNELRSVLSV